MLNFGFLMRKISEYVFRRDNGVLHYMRAVPKDVRELDASILKRCGLPRHQYWRSLKTGDRREAVARTNECDFQFEKKLSKARAMARLARKNLTTANTAASYAFTPDERDLERMVRDWLVGYQDQFGSVDERSFTEQIGELEDVIASLQADWRKNSAPFTVATIADHMIREHGLDLPRNTPLYRRFIRIIHRGQLEFYRRTLSELKGQSGQIFDQELFHPIRYEKDANAGPQSFATIAKLAHDWINQSAASANPKTKALKAHRIGVVVEALGPNRKVTSITREDCERVLSLVIKRYPKNLSKTRGHRPLEETLRIAEKNNEEVISPATQKLYLTNMKSMFAFAVAAGIRPDDPTALLKQKKPRRKVREPFSTIELRTLFSAPIFTGCKDDEDGYKAPGPNRPKRHRYWVPLIALYSGMRINEICQLGADDVVEQRGIWFFNIWADDRENRDNKTTASDRIIPVHPKLIKLGFIEYAKSQKVGRGGLFPDLTGNPKGSGSDKLGKWFGRLCDSQGLSKPTLVFHSFRHNFRDALRETEAPEGVQKFLGGWGDEETQAKYGRGLSARQKFKWMSKVEYPGLNIEALLGVLSANSKAPQGEVKTKTRGRASIEVRTQS